jgi:hypothetical protein
MREDEQPTLEELQRLLARARATVQHARLTIHEALDAVERAKRLCDELRRRGQPPGSEDED